MFGQVQEALQRATAQTLSEFEWDESRGDDEQDGEEEVEITDLRDQIGVFELVGPKSTSVLQGLLDPVQDGSTNSDEVLQVRPSVNYPSTVA